MDLSEQMSYFAENYDIASELIVVDQSSGTKIGSSSNQTCRYCDRCFPEVTFKKKAHAVPEFTGNKWIVSNDECDSCNTCFSQSIEDDFAKYLGALRTISQIYGKNGIPSYKGRDGRSRIDKKSMGLELSTYQEAPIFEIDEENNKLTIYAHRQPYTAMGVFKCLVKMAIAVAPEAELQALSHLKKWILEPEHSYDSFPFKPLLALQQFTPGPRPYPGISIFLLRRKQGEHCVPYMQFVIAFGNTLFQICLPMPYKDQHLIGRPTNLVFFPVPFGDDLTWTPLVGQSAAISK